MLLDVNKLHINIHSLIHQFIHSFIINFVCFSYCWQRFNGLCPNRFWKNRSFPTAHRTSKSFIYFLLFFVFLLLLLLLLLLLFMFAMMTTTNPARFDILKNLHEEKHVHSYFITWAKHNFLLYVYSFCINHICIHIISFIHSFPNLLRSFLLTLSFQSFFSNNCRYIYLLYYLLYLIYYFIILFFRLSWLNQVRMLRNKALVIAALFFQRR